MHTYTDHYDLFATNRSSTDMAAALAALPLDFDTETLLGLSLVSDITTHGTNTARRTISRSTPGGAPPATQPIPDGQPLADVIHGFYAETFSKALGTIVTPSAVGFT